MTSRDSKRVFVSQTVFPESLEPLIARGYEVVYRDIAHPLETEALRVACVGVAAIISFLTDRIDASLFASCPEMEIVSNVAAGVDNIDLDAATASGILVGHTPGVLTEATADLTMALLLATARRIPEGDAYMRGGHYEGWELIQHPIGIDVTGQTLGLFGFGEIGRAVAKRATGGFGMDVTYHSRLRLSKDEEERLDVRWVDWEEQLESSDFLSLHVPLTVNTRHAINRAALRKMKRSAILINTSRGAVVDEGALVEALVSGTIYGAGLDVYENEPAVDGGLLHLRDRVVLLPHVGSATESTRRKMVDMAVTNVIMALEGMDPLAVANPEVLRTDSKES